MEQKYIPGDYVNTLLGIAQILDTYHNGDYYVEGKNFTGQDDNVEPIPLTPEILEKNGWKRATDVSYTKEIVDPVEAICKNLTISENINKTDFTFWHENEPIRVFIYVHQLQHLLFGLGLNSEMEV